MARLRLDFFLLGDATSCYFSMTGSISLLSYPRWGKTFGCLGNRTRVSKRYKSILYPIHQNLLEKMSWCLSKPKISQVCCIKWKVNWDFTWDRFDLKNTCKFTVIIAWEEALLDSSSVRWVEKGLHFWMPFLTQSMWLKSSDFKWDHFESLFLTSFVMQKGDSLSFKNKKIIWFSFILLE